MAAWIELLNGIFYCIFIISVLIRFYLLERRIKEVEKKCSILEDDVVK